MRLFKTPSPRAIYGGGRTCRKTVVFRQSETGDATASPVLFLYHKLKVVALFNRLDIASASVLATAFQHKPELVLRANSHLTYAQRESLSVLQHLYKQTLRQNSTICSILH